MSAAVLYTPEVLALATSLAAWPWDAALPMQAEARSRACGSALSLGVAIDEDDTIGRLGLRCHACAVGQAAAAIFAGAAAGRTIEDIAHTRNALVAWLEGSGPMPDWPGLEAVAAAREYPGRHGAIMLAWKAATQLLPTG